MSAGGGSAGAAEASGPPSWVEVRVLVPAGWEELVAEALAVGPCTSVAFGRPNLAADPVPDGHELVRTFVSSVEDSPELRAALARTLAGLAERAQAPELAGLVAEFRPLPPEDWATSWQKSWKPFRVGRIAVVPPWREAPLRPGDRRLSLEPGGVFGSGRHATTRMCLRELQALVRPGERVLDAGTGSGILAVAAALCGAGEVVGFDIDPNARAYGEDLARTNGVAGRCSFATGGFERLAGERRGFDGVLANIYSDVLQDEAGRLAALLRPGGWFVLSGCPDRHAAATVAALAAAGLAPERTLARGRWRTFRGHRS